ncbi:MAG: hypothetical protein AAF206_23845, partial [Bacteroidota bacterium]
MIRIFRNRRILKIVSVFVFISFLGEIISPSLVYGLTSGPTAPEFSTFTPAGQTEMVNLATGDFTYDIPLMDVEGYPLNLTYQSGITMDQEASMVGLGWNLNIGSMNRNLRGLPDDFKGDEITKEFNIRPNTTYGLNAGLDFELFG